MNVEGNSGEKGIQEEISLRENCQVTRGICKY